MQCTVYALIDAALLERYKVPLHEAAKKLEQLQIPIAQYRDKKAEDEKVAEALDELRRHYSGTLLVNDRLDLTDRADGLHLGQEDLAAIDSDPVKAVEKVRERIGRKILGLSTHNRREIEIANTLDLDYIGLGAYRPTTTKEVACIGGEALLEIARYSRHSVAIIGGVRWEDDFAPPIRYRVLGSSLFERMLSQ